MPDKNHSKTIINLLFELHRAKTIIEDTTCRDCRRKICYSNETRDGITTRTDTCPIKENLDRWNSFLTPIDPFSEKAYRDYMLAQVEKQVAELKINKFKNNNLNENKN